MLKRMIQKSFVCSVKQKPSVPAQFPGFPKPLLNVLVCVAHGELCYEIPQCLETSRAIIIKKNLKKIDSQRLIIGNARYITSIAMDSFPACGLGAAEPCFVGRCAA